MPLPTPDELSNKYKLSLGLVIALVIGAFTVGGAYYKSQADKRELKQEIHDLDFKLEYLNGRYGRKFNRIEEQVINNDNAIRELQINNSCD